MFIVVKGEDLILGDVGGKRGSCRWPFGRMGFRELAANIAII